MSTRADQARHEAQRIKRIRAGNHLIVGNVKDHNHAVTEILGVTDYVERKILDVSGETVAGHEALYNHANIHDRVHGAADHSGNIGTESQIAFSTSAGHTHNGTDSKKISYTDLEDIPAPATGSGSKAFSLLTMGG